MITSPQEESQEFASCGLADYREMVATAWQDSLGVRPTDDAEDFFEAGGNSLQAVDFALRLRQVSGSEVPLDILFERRCLTQLAVYLFETGARTTMPVTPAEERLLYHERLHPGSALYRIPVQYDFHGALDVEALRKTLEDLTDAYAALRCHFTPDGRRSIAAKVSLPLEVVDLTDEPDADFPTSSGQNLEIYLTEATGRPLPVDQAPLARAVLFKRSLVNWTMLLVFHHLIADQRSLDVIDRGLQDFYARRVGAEAGNQSPLPTIGAKSIADKAEARKYWRTSLQGIGDPLNLPLSKAMPVVHGVVGDTVDRTLDPGLAARVVEAARRNATGVSVVLLAAYATALGDMSLSDDVVVAMPAPGRTAAEEQTVGMFVNILPMRVRLKPADTFRQVLSRVRTAVLSGLAHQHVPFQEIVEEITPARETSRNPLTQVGFSYVDESGWRWSVGGIDATRSIRSTGTAKYELLWTVNHSGDELRSALEFSTDLFTGTDAGSVHSRLLRHIDILLGNPDAPLAEISRLAAQSQPSRTAFSSAAPTLPVHEVVLEAARRHPEKVAIRAGADVLTYQRTVALATLVAQRLLTGGVTPADRVAVAVERGAAAVVSFLGVLMSGAAYVPIDVAQPPTRSLEMLSATRTRFAIVRGTHQPHFPAGTEIVSIDSLRLDRDPPETESRSAPTVGPDQPAYVMCTSGSTGHPKYVTVPHRAIRRLVPTSNYVTFNADDVVAQLSNLAFDAATFEIWGALGSGAELVVPDRQTILSPELFRRFFVEHKVTVLFTTSALLNPIVEYAPDAFGRVRALLFGGDQYQISTIRTIAGASSPPRTMVNAYGPTENTTFSAFHRVTPEDLASGEIPIGAAIDGSYLRVLDANLVQVPAGSEGELYVGGFGLAQGYFGDPVRTATRFVADPKATEPGERLYRTGDVVRLKENGDVLFLGRADDQIKVRGFRVELGEVERALTSCPGVGTGIAVASKAGRHTKLMAVVTGAVQRADVIRHLRSKVPEYMVPTHILVAESLPLTPNGKVDRRACQHLVSEISGSTQAEPATAEILNVEEIRGDPHPENDFVRAFADLWREVLEVDGPIRPDSDFIDSGGQSIKALRLVGLVYSRFGVELGIAAVFGRPTFGALTAEVRALLAQGGKSNG